MNPSRRKGEVVQRDAHRREQLGFRAPSLKAARLPTFDSQPAVNASASAVQKQAAADRPRATSWKPNGGPPWPPADAPRSSERTSKKQRSDDEGWFSTDQKQDVPTTGALRLAGLTRRSSLHPSTQGHRAALPRRHPSEDSSHHRWRCWDADLHDLGGSSAEGLQQ